MDDIITGLQCSKEEPVIAEQELKHYLFNMNEVNGHKEELFINEMIRFKRTLVGQVGNEELMVTLDVLESEMKLDHSRVPVMQGMLSNLKLYPDFRDFRERLAMYYKITN
ncbi:TPA: hypothetical protein ROX88_003464 [Bacillus pseudomycoides]|nr:hypothetical protein [Bacillus pseudomycoides]